MRCEKFRHLLADFKIRKSIEGNPYILHLAFAYELDAARFIFRCSLWEAGFVRHAAGLRR